MNEENNSNNARVPIPPISVSNPLWAAICMLAIAMAGGGWYLHQEMNHQAPSQSAVSQLRTSVGSLRAQLSAQEASFKGWSHQALDLDKRMDKVEAGFKNSRSMTQRHAQRILKPMVTKMKANLDQNVAAKTAAIESHLAKLDAQQQLVSMQLTHLQNQQTAANTALTALRVNSQSQVTALSQEEQRLARKVIMPTRKEQQVHFEAVRDHIDKVEPGIYLTVLSTNPGKQQYSGYVELLEDRSTVWIKNQDIQVPLVIRPKTSGQTLELVVNHVTSQDVTGYVALPASDAAYVKAADVVVNTAAVHSSGVMR